MSSLPETLSSEEVGSSLPTTRVDRLLRERIRRNRSHQAFDAYEDLPMEDPVLETVPEPPTISRLVVVANRLPVTCSKDSSGRWQLQASAGGLVSALKGVSNYVALWIGWPGVWVKPGREREELTSLLKAEGYSPVWMDQTLLDLYYNGFCNSVLWQLFHYVPLNIDSWQKMAEHRAMQMQWQAYQVANEKFADVVLSEYAPHDVVWVQDYHLMLLPSLLKQAVPKMKVGFFLHTPFPSSEIYRTLPVREEVLRAVLAADLVGFHTYDYARHFISSCTRILGLEGTPEGVENNGVLTRVGTFPIGIDPERFTGALESEEVQGQTAKLLNRYAGRKIMLGVDRLDMVKGIPQKLLAYEKFLEEHPEWRDKVLLVQIAVPSRTDVVEYQKLRSMVHEIVGRINGQYGTLTYVPIYHLDTSLSFTELCALYAVTDVALVTSLRDGMNLVSYEYVACQSDNAGVLVLSEFAGAAQSLGAGALLVNPWNISDMSTAIYDALSMSEEERRERHRQNYMHVQTHTAQHWADTFITELNDTHIEADLRMRHTPPPLDIQEVVRAYLCSKRRLIVLGYNATLTTSVEAPRLPKRQFEQVKALAKVNPRVMQSVCELCTDPANVVAIFSGSETAKLDEIFGHLPVWLAAENGVYVRPPPGPPAGAGGGGVGSPSARGGHAGGQGGRQAGGAAQPPPQWQCVFDQVHCEWMESVQLVFDYFCERTPRSFVEARETSLVWNYKYADVEFGRIQARDLLQHLWTGPISNAPVEIIQGGKSVEVRPVGVTKGLAMQRLVGLIAAESGIEAAAFDMALCIGHLLGRDENLFSLFEGDRIDGAAPVHNSRAERAFAAAAAAAAAAAGGGGGGASGAASGLGSGNGGVGHALSEMLERARAARGGVGGVGGVGNGALAGLTAQLQGLGLHPPHGNQQHHTASQPLPYQSYPQGQPMQQHGLSRHGRSSSTGGLGGALGGGGSGSGGHTGGGALPGGGLTQALAASSSTSGPHPLPAHAHAAAHAAAHGGGGSGSNSPFATQSHPHLHPAASQQHHHHQQQGPPHLQGQQQGQGQAYGDFHSPTHGTTTGAPGPSPAQQQQDGSGNGGGSCNAAAEASSSSRASGGGAAAAAAAAGGEAGPGSTAPAGHLHPRTSTPGFPTHLHPHSHGLNPPGGPGTAPPPPPAPPPFLHQSSFPHHPSRGLHSRGGPHGSGSMERLEALGGHLNLNHNHNLNRALGGNTVSTSSVASMADRLAGIFPPKYLYTCTVGRNRSKARYALATSAEVGDLLEALVQQGIYHHAPAAPCACSAPADFSLVGVGALAGGRLDSLSSADALSPDSMMAGYGGQHRSYRAMERRTSISLASEEGPSLPHSPGPAADYSAAAAAAAAAHAAAAAVAAGELLSQSAPPHPQAPLHLPLHHHPNHLNQHLPPPQQHQQQQYLQQQYPQQHPAPQQSGGYAPAGGSSSSGGVAAAGGSRGVAAAAAASTGVPSSRRPGVTSSLSAGGAHPGAVAGVPLVAMSPPMLPEQLLVRPPQLLQTPPPQLLLQQQQQRQQQQLRQGHPQQPSKLPLQPLQLDADGADASSEEPDVFADGAGV